MKVAIIGSRTLRIDNIEEYLPDNVTEIVSGGAKGIDSCAKIYAETHNLKYTEFLPEYDKYGRAAPIRRNDCIIDYADCVVAIWDGKSRGTEYVIKKCETNNKILIVIEKEA